MLKIEDVLSDIARLGKEHDEALEQHDDCIEAIDAKAGHPKYDAILDEVHTDELTCKELTWAAKQWAKKARDIIKERTELQSIFEQNKLSLTEFDANEFHMHKKSKLTDDERGFYERVTRVLDKSHPVQKPMTKQDMKKLLTTIQDDTEALEDVDILDRRAPNDDDKESVNGIEDEEDEPQSVIEAQKWMGFRIPADMFAQLQDHQRDGLWLMCERAFNDSGTLLAHAPGLGKTLTTLCFLSCLKFKCKTARSIVVCDKSLLLQWGAQVSKFNSFLHLRTFTVKDSSKLVFLHSQWKRTHGGVLIMSTDLFRAQLVDDKKKPNQPASKRARDKARVAQPKCKLDITADTTVVVDEAHKFLQTGHSEFYSVVLNLPTNLRILLTGTPMQHSLSKYYNMVKLIAPDLLPDTNLDFQDTYSKKIETGAKAEAKDDLDAQHDANLTMHILVKHLEKAVAYKMADDVLETALPPKVEFIIRHPLDEGTDAYDDWSGSGMDKREMVHARSRDTKTKIFQCLMRKFDETERCLVFSSRIATLKHMKEEYESDERHCGLLTGEVTNIYARNALIYEFFETPGSVLFLSTDLGACGLDLSVASLVIILDVSWNPLVEEQAVARAYRLGQEKSVFVYRLVAAPTAESIIYITGIKKRRLASTIDGESNVACAYKDSDLIIGNIIEDTSLEKDHDYHRHCKDMLALKSKGLEEEKDRMDDLLNFLMEEFKMDEDVLRWAVHDVNATVEQKHDNVHWIHNQYDNELNRRISVGDAPRLLLDADDNEINIPNDTIYDDEGNLVTPVPIAFLCTDTSDYPCVNFYYPSQQYKVDPEEAKEEIADKRNHPHAWIQIWDNHSKSNIYGIFAPSPTVCLANGVNIELYRLELTKDRMDPDEYDESNWDQMEMNIGALIKIDAFRNSTLKMSDIQDEEGVYLFAEGLWVFKTRLVDESGKMSCCSPPSALIKIEKRDFEDFEEEEADDK